MTLRSESPVGASLDQRFAEAMGAALGPDFPESIALAVSGGGDSMAMLTLAHNWTHVWGVRLRVVTVDHGLRPEAAAEAQMVAETCAELGWEHQTLRWHWDGQGNLMDAARRARLSLIDAWRGDTRDVLLAHTADDVAESFLMRLARGAGVEGLSAMRPVREVHAGQGTPMRILRPCLDMRRAELRHYLRVLQGQWVDDPSNDDEKYERVRARRLVARLEAEGTLAGADLSGAAARMARASEALRARAAQVWGEIAVAPSPQRLGELICDQSGFQCVERDTQLRLLSSALRYVSGAEYPPREAPLEALLDRLLGGGGGTLHGCEARIERGCIAIFREFAAVQELRVPAVAAALWDGRWRLARDVPEGLILRALGEDGWAQRDRAAPQPVPFHAARSAPALFEGARLVGCDALQPTGELPLFDFCLFGHGGQDFAAFLRYGPASG
ncbi:tRNA lysidine(34) synthetase TilS [Alloyangia pacifica]|uniref:tRNA(Ile)-lysidine synthase n=1 Tax=Alloyangia pacifica TaxID=311180 RepID=A0A1I6QNG0_9RHOB|nr:tRNA lysidine(34) synthetase TilS [Alloyangia pacifica]SDF93794.1 tRNA(Ile)-lysidine synthase [Alloyangia pacifica]SFS53979.1 tRNA(Ile)-lysidine synthase [Alloyangia pacifica]